MNYRDLINTIFPVNCLIYTVQSPARSHPFSGYSDPDYTPRTIQCIRCTSINADYQLHSFTIVCRILPGLRRGGLSSLAAGERKGGSHGQEGGPPTADSGLTGLLSALFLPQLLQSRPEHGPSSHLHLVHHWETSVSKTFPIFQLLLSEPGVGHRDLWTQVPKLLHLLCSFPPEHLRQKPRNALLTISFHQKGHATNS